ncbi:MAG: aspartate kinase [Peptococcaceae bacterium]|nr:aspartate kinase [Peptococcaceae bacterium]
MRFVVQKFGGTSLATPELREKSANKIVDCLKAGYYPVVVVSAMGRKGDPYATDTLLSLFFPLEFVPSRERDLLMSCGEIISGVLMAATLRQKGYPAVFLTGGQSGIITNGDYTEARILRVNPERIIDQARDGKIIVVAGFQGVSEEGEITTLGRGGSDTTAAALGVALNAACIEIFTDVDGIMKADPRIVGDSTPLEKVTYNEICQLAQEGAKVIHPRAVEIAMQKNIPIWVKPIFSDAPGTLITSHTEIFRDVTDITSDRLITGITYIQNITQINIEIDNPDLCNPSKIFRPLADAGISVDLINVNPHLIAFTVKDEVAVKAENILKEIGFEPQCLPGCAKIALVGAGMTGIPGVMAGIVEALDKNGITILQSADSYTTIWVLVKQEDKDKAIRALFHQFKLGD